MKKAALYARVSSDLQRKEGTIESQILELRKQIFLAGDVIVKEYIDDGYEGARLDRPALDQMRQDLKTDVFDAIYFHNTDRIAREVTFQTIIIGEILKYRKQIIINGKDYVQNPENKFTLTILGAVAELERAKIAERVGRGKALKLAKGYHAGRGCNLFGYDYVHKTSETAAPHLEINEREATIVRLVFTEYAKGGIGMKQITRMLEDQGHLTKTGKKLWRIGILKSMLQNHAYIGTMYFNKMKVVKEYANPLYGIATTSKKVVARDRADWIGIEVPALVSKAIFDKVQAQIEWNRKRYRNPKCVQLLSSLIRCGHCGSSFYAYRRYYIDKRAKEPKVYHRVAYKCNWKLRMNMHSKNSVLRPCVSKEITSEVMESKVLKMIQETMLDSQKLREGMDIFKRRGSEPQNRIQAKLRAIDLKIEKTNRAKRRLLDLYASGEIERIAYIKRSREFDSTTVQLAHDRQELIQRVPLLHKKESIRESIATFCELARLRYRGCNDFDTKRQFLLDYIKEIKYRNDKVELHGLVPINTPLKRAFDNSSSASIEFRISTLISQSDRYGSKGQADHTRISMAQHNEILLSD